MGQSLCADVQIFLSSLFLINPTFCVGSGIRRLQGRFCAYATVINEAPDLMSELNNACFTLDVQAVRRRRSSCVYAEQEQRVPIVLSYWQRLLHAAEP